LDQRFDRIPSPHLATLLSQNDFVPKSSPRRIPRFFRRNARFELFLLPQLPVQAYLFFKVAVELLSPHQHQ